MIQQELFIDVSKDRKQVYQDKEKAKEQYYLNNEYKILDSIRRAEQDIKEDNKRYLESQDISEKQISFIKYLAYKKGVYNQLDLVKLSLLNKYQASELIEELEQ